MNNYIKIFLFIGLALLIITGVTAVANTQHNDTAIPTRKPQPLWSIRSIDTVKYSRDLAAEKIDDSSFDTTINEQVRLISETGATHVAIATPYDERFLPYLRRWVQAARKYHLKVWFRGNFSGWEGWFGYAKINRETHLSLTQKFILSHPGLFENGDIFTACPECENGGPPAGGGDPRNTGDIKSFQKFLINEYQVTKEAFKQINKNVSSNYDSMNLDVARAVMDKKTTERLDGLVTVDHYVANSDSLVRDVQELASQSGGKIILGEFGAPIPDINGQMTDKQQADWIESALGKLADEPEVIGLNYWTGFGGSTKIWNDDRSPRAAVKVLEHYFRLLK